MWLLFIQHLLLSLLIHSDRIGVETDPETQMDLERELEIQKIQVANFITD